MIPDVPLTSEEIVTQTSDLRVAEDYIAIEH